ncbi:MAG: S-methyl-5-thioribose-1-phosphate isomerase [Gemmatimonadetes bacterium]|nr:S-methyl-5-thioribose-1-phosphate isomerase [Gemmatimonadota bacterium]
MPEAIRWSGDGAAVELLDQTRLPTEEVYLRLDSAAEVAEAIRVMRIRGAPALGIAAAMGVALELARAARGPAADLAATFGEARALLLSTRPTGHNLAWALERMGRRFRACGGERPAAVVAALTAEATLIAEEDRLACRRIGEFGLELLPGEGATVYTHCNAGALATGGIGTAVAPIYLARERGIPVRVIVGETRPLLQGARLTAWELGRAGLDVTLVVDSAAGALMKEGRVNLVITGADRIAANGDAANKIGTYGLAVLARHHGIPFYVAAPLSTIDPATPSGADIPIEERYGAEVRCGFGRVTAPADVAVANPAFDVTPAELVTAIVTDRGILRPPYGAAIAEALEP